MVGIMIVCWVNGIEEIFSINRNSGQTSFHACNQIVFFCILFYHKTNETSSNKYLKYNLKFITVNYLELTNHDPILKLMIICETETILNFSQRKKNSLEGSCFFLSSILARTSVYTRSIKIRIGVRLRTCTNLSGRNKIDEQKVYPVRNYSMRRPLRP